MTRFRILGLFVLGIGAAVGALWLFSLPPFRKVAPKPAAFTEAEKVSLPEAAAIVDPRDTVVLATLDEPLPPGKNAIWCASFPLAWQRLKSNVIKAPIRIRGAEALCERLDRAAVADGDLPPASHYADAGRVADGIIPKIRADMAKLFPALPPPELDAEQVIIAYAYLAATVKFDLPYFDHRKPMTFTSGSGQEAAVRS